MPEISLELAKKLKELGLKWNPQPGDCHCWAGIYSVVKNGFYIEQTETNIWLPRLKQLIQEVEKEGYCWGFIKESLWSGYLFSLVDSPAPIFYGTTPENAVAQALIWIYEHKEGCNV